MCISPLLCTGAVVGDAAGAVVGVTVDTSAVFGVVVGAVVGAETAASTTDGEALDAESLSIRFGVVSDCDFTPAAASFGGGVGTSAPPPLPSPLSLPAAAVTAAVFLEAAEREEICVASWSTENDRK